MNANPHWLATYIDMTGRRFGAWTVLKRSHTKRIRNGRTKTNRIFWLCRCDCGAARTVPGPALRRGESKSCSVTCAAKLRGESRIGETFGCWKVLGPAAAPGTVWDCECARCGRAEQLAYFHLGRRCPDCTARAREAAAPAREARGRAKRRAWYRENRERYLPRFRAYHADNRPKILAYDRMRRVRDREKLKVRARLYRAKNRPAVNGRRRASSARDRTELADRYLRGLLAHVGFPRSRITPNHVALKRSVLLVQRATRRNSWLRNLKPRPSTTSRLT